MAEQLKRFGLPRAEMLKRVARFAELNGSDGGLPDSRRPGSERTLYNVIGFQPPASDNKAVTSPVGDEASRLAAIKVSEGFNLGYCRALPGHGPMMHNHDTNETFIAMTGRWRCSWEDENGKVEHVDIGPFDVCSFPPGVARRFENVTDGDPNEESVLMFVIAGNAPQAEFTDEAMAELERTGVLHRGQTHPPPDVARREVARRRHDDATKHANSRVEELGSGRKQ